MWTKISNALKGRTEPGQVSTAREIVEEKPVPAPSPPSSPSKYGRLGLFKRPTKLYHDNSSSLNLAKKVKTSLHINTNLNSSNMSLIPPSATESASLFTGDSARTVFLDQNMPTTPLLNIKEMPASGKNHVSSIPQDQLQFDATQPAFGSIRSILRDQKTPSSGQNVRFFSRDAYRVISPDSSINNSTSDPPEPSFMQRLMDVSPEHTVTGNVDSTSFHSAIASPNTMLSPPLSSRANGIFLDVKPKNNEDALSPPDDQARFSMNSLLVPIPAPELTDIFDLSAAQEHGVQAIPVEVDKALQDGAVEIDDFGQVVKSEEMPAPVFKKLSNEKAETSLKYATISSAPLAITGADTSVNTQSLGRKAGESVFSFLSGSGKKQSALLDTHTAPRSASSLGLYKLFSESGENKEQLTLESPLSVAASNRARAQSEHLLRRPFLTDSDLRSTGSKKRNSPEADINDTSATDIVLYEAKRAESPDPFRVDAANYYTSDAGIPDSPPKLIHARSASGESARTMNSIIAPSQKSAKSHNSSGASQRSASKRVEDSDLLLSLQTQLAFHQELTSQYELDLSARDELVILLSSKLKTSEEENEKRAKTVRGWRKKIAELERACRSLEDQVDRSKQESFERSVMDEASSEALRHLHRQISQLEKERNDTEKREQDLKTENRRLKEEVSMRKEMEQNLQEGIERAKADMEAMRSADQSMERGVDDMKFLMTQGEKEYNEEFERHQAAESAWNEERDLLTSRLVQIDDLQEKLNATQNEMITLKEELEVQWTNTESLSEKMQQLEKDKGALEAERDYLKDEITNLEARMSDMEVEWTESENKRNEVEASAMESWAAEQKAIEERDMAQEKYNREHDLHEETRNEVERIKAEAEVLQQEKQFERSNVERVQALLRERDEKASADILKLSEKDHELESLRDELSSLKRVHAKVLSDHTRSLSDNETRELNIRQQLEDTVRKETEARLEAKDLTERMENYEKTIEQQRREIHKLQKQSADNEVTIMEIKRKHKQDRETIDGLNLALDSKQQELELVKRKKEVGAVGSTPASTRIGMRRESAAFMTPMVSRPPSAMSDTDKALKQIGETPSTTGKTILGAHMRTNAPSAPPSTIKVKRLSTNAMGPPARSRASLSSVTATPSLLRSSSMRAATTQPILHHKRAASSTINGTLASKTALKRGVTGNTSDASNTQEDKENTKPTPVKSTLIRRGSLVPS